MASFGMGSFGAAAAAGGRVFTAKAASKSAGGSSSASEEKGLWDWIVGALEKDQLLETDPVLKKVGEKAGGTTTRVSKGTTSVSAQPSNNKKPGGLFGGLFAKN